MLPVARDVLLALATTAAVAWLACDALRTDQPGARSRLVMAVALALGVAAPALLLAFDHGLWAGTVKPSLGAGLAVMSVGVLSLAVGSRLAGAVPLPDRLRSIAHPAPALLGARPRGRIAYLALAILVLVSLGLFVHAVGGPVAYLKNLNNSGAATSGLTYYIWGISFAKFASYVELGEAWRAGRRPAVAVGAAAAVALAMLLFIGSRLLLLVALAQLLLLYAAIGGLGRRFRMTVAATVAVGAVAFLVIGEYRRWENVPRHRAFPTYFADTALPQLPRTYVNQYADAVRLSVLAREVVPSRAGFEYGKELLRVLLHPLPSAIRPTVAQAPALAATFTSGHKNGNALPIPVEGYIEFGLAGAILFSLLLGSAVGAIDRAGAAVPDVGWLAAAIAAGTGAVIVFRGSLAPGVALATIDVVGFFVTHRILFRRAAVGEESTPGAAMPGPLTTGRVPA
jgi:hypothetical protein